MHLFTQSALLKALGWSLFNSLWQMALLWLVYFILTAVFRKASANIRHSLALLLISAGTGWFVLSFISGVLFTDGSAGYPLIYSGTAFTAGLPREFIGQLLPYGSFLYLLVMAFLLIRYFSHYLHSRRLKTTGLSKIQPQLRLFVAETSQLMGIGKKVQVWLSSLVETPVTLGFLKPVILIPIATVNHLSIQQVEAILLHELAHIKRYDYLLNLGLTVLEVVFFFNPFALRLIRNIKREREHRCDDLVMQFRYDPHVYVSALLSLATDGLRRQNMALAATGKNDRLLLHRVRRILNQKSKVERPGARPVVLLLLILFAGLISLSRPALPIAKLIFVQKQKVVATAGSPDIPSVILNSSFVKEKVAAPSPAPQAEEHVVSGPSTSDEETAELPEGFIQASSTQSDEEDPGYTVTAGMKEAVPADRLNREYSIGQIPVTVYVPSVTPEEDQPFVPNSSFSSGHTLDSTYQLLQLAYVADKAARKEMERGMKVLQSQQVVLIRLQKKLSFNLKVATGKITPATRPDLPQIQQDLELEQSRLTQEYLQKQKELLKQLHKAGKARIIVHI